MLGRTTGAVLVGVEARLIEVEADLTGGLPTIAAVGLAAPAVREGIDRIRSALAHAGFPLPSRRVVVNLAPADVRKQGTGLDLPIALAILLGNDEHASLEKLRVLDTRKLLLAGELGLDGTLRPIRGALSIALAAKQAGKRSLLLPRANADEAALVRGIEVVGLNDLAELIAYATGVRPAPVRIDPERLLATSQGDAGAPDLADVKGQAGARRAAEIAVSGGHHLLLCGPPGSGKTMLAQRLPTILPPLELDEALVATRVWSAAGLTQSLVTRRPFRAPHHGISLAGMTGGGPRLRPGEIALASQGVLFLDELTEFRRDTLESLRQPLEDGQITVVRVQGAAHFSAEFMLVASMNPCPCGYYGQPDGRCGCTPLQVRRYRSRLSGPLLDRFDLVVEVPPVDLDSLARASPGESSEAVRRRVVAARCRQRERFGPSGAACNARMSPGELSRFAALDRDGRRLLLAACARLGLSARGFDRVRRVALTVADLQGCSAIEPAHVAEALQYRHPDTLGRD